MVKKKKFKKTKKKPEPELEKKVLKKLIQEDLEEETEEKPEQEIPIEIPLEKDSIKLTSGLQSSFRFQPKPFQSDLEESVADVEVEKKDEKREEFYNSQGPTNNGSDKKYSTSSQPSFERLADIESNRPIFNSATEIRNTRLQQLNPDIISETKKYSSEGPQEKYGLNNLDRYDLTKNFDKETKNVNLRERDFQKYSSRG